MEHRQLLKVDDVVAVLGVALGEDGHTACDDAARLFHELLNSGDFERHINRVRRAKRRELSKT